MLLQMKDFWEPLHNGNIYGVLVEMLDYRPGPPNSASTLIALMTKEDARPGLVKKGLQVSFQPDTGDRLVFETLEDVEVDPRLNEIRLHGYDHNSEPLTPLNMLGIWPPP